MRKSTAWILFLLLSVGTGGQAVAEDYQAIAQTFFQELATKGAVDAVDNLYATNRWISSQSDAVINLKNQLGGVGNLVGDYYGVERIAEFQVGTRFVYLSYMALYDRQPLRFIFEFYKPKDRWRVYSFSFDDKLDNDLEREVLRADWFKTR